jgi:hypothetical protein
MISVLTRVTPHLPIIGNLGAHGRPMAVHRGFLGGLRDAESVASPAHL